MGGFLWPALIAALRVALILRPLCDRLKAGGWNTAPANSTQGVEV